MSKLVIVDTDILIDAGRGIKQAVDYLHKYEADAHLAISSITQMELIVGCRNKNELQRLKEFTDRFQVLHISEDISAEGVRLLTEYRLSHGLLIADALIAATAIVNISLFASKNQKHYQFIENLSLLEYE